MSHFNGPEGWGEDDFRRGSVEGKAWKPGSGGGGSPDLGVPRHLPQTSEVLPGEEVVGGDWA